MDTPDIVYILVEGDGTSLSGRPEIKGFTHNQEIARGWRESLPDGSWIYRAYWWISKLELF